MTIRVFVGCAANGEDAESCAVLEHSLRANASEPVEITWMMQSRDRGSFWAGWATERFATPFSGFRWGVPAFCNYQGRAIYTDSDVIFLGDVAELWRQPIPGGKVVLGKGGGSWRLCVSLWDCAAAQKFLPPIMVMKSDPSAHAKINQSIKAHIAPFEGDWNCLDGGDYKKLTDPRLKALHYTDMSTQPHLKHAIPRLKAAGQKHWFDGKVKPHPRKDVQRLFDDLLVAAAREGYRVENYIPEVPFGEYRKASLVNYRGRAA